MRTLATKVDLSQGKDPTTFYTCLLPDSKSIEAWRASPAAHDHRIPSSNWCAMTCIRMLQQLQGMTPETLESLFERACDLGVYRDSPESTGWVGAYHNALVEFLRKCGFRARAMRNTDVAFLAHALNAGLYILPSVGPDIRFHTIDAPSKTSGHIVLGFGYTINSVEGLTFRIQNCAGFASLNTQVDVPISISRMRQVFSGNVILVRAT